MKIHSKRGIWYVTEPGHPVMRFPTEEAASAYVKGEHPVEPDHDHDDEWEDDEE